MSEERSKHPLGVIMITDDTEDAVKFGERLKSAGVKNPLVILGTAQEGYEYMRGKGKYENMPRPRPGVVLLDLSLPDAHGSEFLEFLKSHQKLASIPVVVLTDADSTQSPSLLRKHGAAGIIEMPVSLDAFLRTMEPIGADWIEFNRVGRPVAPEAD